MGMGKRLLAADTGLKPKDHVEGPGQACPERQAGRAKGAVLARGADLEQHRQ
jgi:hypothetical protein